MFLFLSASNLNNKLKRNNWDTQINLFRLEPANSTNIETCLQIKTQRRG